jgi:hypothetical protein
VVFGDSEQDNRRALGLCRDSGLKAIVSHASIAAASAVDTPGWEQKIEQFIKTYRDDPAIGMWESQDEPTVPQFAALAKIKAEVARHDPKRAVFINLFPTYATPGQLGAADYSAYLKAYADTVHPPFVSYDHYALIADGSHRGDYYLNLELVRKSALSQKVPAWDGILSFPHYGYADPTEAQMRWQVYTSLAVGMKGYYWFTLFPPGADLGPKPAILDDKARPARLYPIVKQLNYEARHLGRTLAGLTSTGLYFTGPTPGGCAKLPDDAPLQVTSDTPLMLGFFKNPSGERFAMLVNTDDVHPVDVVLSAQDGVRSLNVISPRDGNEEPFARTGDGWKFALPAGDGRLFKLKK